MFEIELIIYIKMDLALNNPQRLIYHKTQTKPKPKLIQELERKNTFHRLILLFFFFFKLLFVHTVFSHQF